MIKPRFISIKLSLNVILQLSTSRVTPGKLCVVLSLRPFCSMMLFASITQGCHLQNGNEKSVNRSDDLHQSLLNVRGCWGWGWGVVGRDVTMKKIRFRMKPFCGLCSGGMVHVRWTLV
jgi:hypothetical protein